MRSINFTVYGKPTPQGSTRAFIPKGWKRAIITTDNTNLKPWRQQIAGAAVNLQAEMFEVGVPVKMKLDFYFDRPKSATVKKRPGMTVKPDGDKLVRAVLDAIKGILIHDDAQVVNHHARKFYGSPERVEITVSDECE